MAHDDQGPTDGITPHLTILGGQAAAAIDFYVAAFGAEERDRKPAPDGQRLIHAHLTVNGASLLLNDDFPEFTGPMAAPSAVTLHLAVDDADAWVDRAVAAGASVRMPIADQFWGDRYGQVEDPFGHRWSIGGPARG